MHIFVTVLAMRSWYWAIYLAQADAFDPRQGAVWIAEVEEEIN
jgi:hypothetical protein